jgi:hypothetical protein
LPIINTLVDVTTLQELAFKLLSPLAISETVLIWRRSNFTGSASAVELIGRT